MAATLINNSYMGVFRWRLDCSWKVRVVLQAVSVTCSCYLPTQPSCSDAN